MAPLLQSATTPTDGSAIVTVRGDLDTDTAAQLWQYLGDLMSSWNWLAAPKTTGVIPQLGVDRHRRTTRPIVSSHGQLV